MQILAERPLFILGSLCWEDISLEHLTAYRGQGETNTDADMRGWRAAQGRHVPEAHRAHGHPRDGVLSVGSLPLAATQSCPKLGSLQPFLSPPLLPQHICSTSQRFLVPSFGSVTAAIGLGPGRHQPFSPALLAWSRPDQLPPTQPAPCHQAGYLNINTGQPVPSQSISRVSLHFPMMPELLGTAVGVLHLDTTGLSQLQVATHAVPTCWNTRPSLYPPG